ncbi:TPA: hypothetical protein QCS28_003289, partial [Bacillus thuringiensis]|nr:hypothetical protein [Bacillus thuringiensis]
RNLTDNEVSFIENFKEDSDNVTKVTHVVTENEKYIWGNDFDIDDFDFEEEEEGEYEVYAMCAKCGEGISHSNDAGNGFCTSCPE